MSRAFPISGDVLGRGIAMSYLSIVALIPLAAVVAKSMGGGVDSFWSAITTDQAIASLKLTLVASVIVVLVNAVFGTLIAWVLVRDEFPGKGIVNSLIDLPFALPTIVAGLTLLLLYGPDSPVGINLAFTRASRGARAVVRDASRSSSGPCSRCCSSWTWRWSRRPSRWGRAGSRSSGASSCPT